MINNNHNRSLLAFEQLCILVDSAIIFKFGFYSLTSALAMRWSQQDREIIATQSQMRTFWDEEKQFGLYVCLFFSCYCGYILGGNGEEDRPFNFMRGLFQRLKKQIIALVRNFVILKTRASLVSVMGSCRMILVLRLITQMAHAKVSHAFVYRNNNDIFILCIYKS